MDMQVRDRRRKRITVGEKQPKIVLREQLDKDAVTNENVQFRRQNYQLVVTLMWNHPPSLTLEKWLCYARIVKHTTGFLSK